MALVLSSLPPIVRLEVSLLVPLDGDDLRVNALQYFCEKKTINGLVSISRLLVIKRCYACCSF